MTYEEKEKNKKKIYDIRFDGLYDLHEYLTSNPEVNRKVFYEQSSLDIDEEFYGESLKKSIKYLTGGYKKELDNFLKINDELRTNCFDLTDELIQRRGIFGGVPLAPLVAAGVPDCMLRYERNQDLRVVNVYFNLGYPCYTSTNAIINRGLAAIYLIQSLEQKGYIVNFYAYELSSCGDEIVNIEIKLKTNSDLFFNVEKCYYPMRAKEFLRRLLFRVLESTPVKNNWIDGYGRPAKISEVRKFYEIEGESLVIGSPSEMGIDGYNIYKDTENLIRKLKVSDEFDMERIDYYANRRNK